MDIAQLLHGRGDAAALCDTVAANHVILLIWGYAADMGTSGCNMTRLRKDGNSLLHTAAQEGFARLCRWIIDGGLIGECLLCRCGNLGIML